MSNARLTFVLLLLSGWSFRISLPAIIRSAGCTKELPATRIMAVGSQAAAGLTDFHTWEES